VPATTIEQNLLKVPEPATLGRRTGPNSVILIVVTGSSLARIAVWKH
jgi:hypothetical protein